MELEKFLFNKILNTTMRYPTSSDEVTIKCAFLDSEDLYVYPCGRRNSTLIEGDNGTLQDDFYYPFDPEARLNTEFNNRSISSLNGFTQTYVKSWSEDAQEIHLVLGGYSFRIRPKVADKLDKLTFNAFSEDLFENLKLSDDVADEITKIYANIRLELTPLYRGSTLDKGVDGIIASTWILRDQVDRNNTENYTVDFSPCLDKLKSGASKPMPEDYYFSGLSFSTEPIAQFNNYRSVLNKKDKIPTYAVSHFPQDIWENGASEQIAISLCILEKKDGNWQVYQPALLPDIRHGDAANKVELDHLLVEGNLEVEGNIDADAEGAIAKFYDVDITNNTVIHKDLTVERNTTIKGDLKANTKDKIAQFYDVKVDNNLHVENTLDTDVLLTNTVQVRDEAYRLQKTDANSKPMGFVTMEVINITNETKMPNKLVFYTTNGNLPESAITPPEIADAEEAELINNLS